MRASYDHLLSKQPNQTDSIEEEMDHYKKEDKFALEKAKKADTQCS